MNKETNRKKRRRTRVAVTGGRGLLGRYVVTALEPDYEVTVIDRVGDASEHPIDVLDLDTLREAIRGYDAIVHLAAIDAAVDASPQTFFHVNTLAAWNTLHAGFEEGVRKFVVCSSSSTYGVRTESSPPMPLYLSIDEAHPTRATSAYGLSKRTTELITQGFAERADVSAIVLRPCYVAYPHLLPRMASQQKTAPEGAWQEPLPPLGWYVDPEDAAQCFRLALEADGIDYDVFNVAASDTFTAQPTLSLVEELYGGLPEVKTPERFDENPHASPLDNAHARDVLGWKPRGDWAALLARHGISSKI